MNGSKATRNRSTTEFLILTSYVRFDVRFDVRFIFFDYFNLIEFIVNGSLNDMIHVKKGN